MLPISVRRLCLWLLACIALALTAACDRPPSTASPSHRQDDSGPSTLVLYTWADYVPEEVLDRFTRTTGIGVRYRTYENTDELTSELASRPELYDVIITDGYTVNRLVRNQFVTTFNRALLPHFDNIDTDFRGRAFDPENRYSIPYLWGATLIAFNPNQVDVSERSWSLLWDRQALGDQPVLLVDEPIDLFSMALLERGDSINSSDPQQLEQAAERLQEQFDLVNVRHTDVLEIRTALENGECAAAMIYSGDALMAKQVNDDIEILIPEDGVPLWIDHFLISRESPNPKLAHALIDYLLEGHNAAACANYACCPSPNRAATPYVIETLRRGGAGVPTTDVMARSEFQNNASTSKLRQIALLMRGIKQRDRRTAAPEDSSSKP